MSMNNSTVTSNQNATISSLNSFSNVLTAGQTYFGSSESILNSNGIQVNIFSDQQTTIQVQQSSNGTNWDIVDSYIISASTGDGRTFQARSAFFRIVATNNGIVSTTAFRLQTILKPIGEAIPGAIGQQVMAKSTSVAIALNQSPIPSTQSGIWQTETAARTALEQTFIVQTILTTLGTTETAFLLIKNPSGSGKTLRIRKIKAGTTGGGISGGGTFRIYHTPTITANGTSKAIINRYIKASPAVTVMTAFTAPTISANGTNIYLFLTTTQTGSSEYFSDGDIILDPNFNLLITTQNTANNIPTEVSVEWTEV